jgi:hypothetical protein
MGLFGCTHKSLAMGVPLITPIYEGDPNIGFYTLPLLIWHPLELLIGSSLAPMLSKFINAENERLSIPVRRSGESYCSCQITFMTTRKEIIYPPAFDPILSFTVVVEVDGDDVCCWMICC